MCFCLGNTAHIPHFCCKEQILKKMALIYKNTVNAQLLKGNHIVLAALVVQLRQPGFQGFPGALHLLDGIVLRMIPLGFPDAVQDAVDLPPENNLLPLFGHRDFLKLRVSDDDGIIIAGGNPGAELLPVLGFKILFGGNQNIGGWVELEPFRRPLLRDVVCTTIRDLVHRPSRLLSIAAATISKVFPAPTSWASNVFPPYMMWAMALI